MGGHNPYDIPSKKTYFTDRWGRRILYDSVAESRMARLLDREGIKFEVHVQYKCFFRDGKPFSYRVDFVTEVPIRPMGFHKHVTAIEVKGVLYFEALERLAGLEYSHNIKGYIVLPALIDMWEKQGMFVKKGANQ